MLPEGQTALAEAAEQQDGFPAALGALRALARMDPVDPAAIDFRMARALKNMGSLEESKHHVLRGTAGSSTISRSSLRYCSNCRGWKHRWKMIRTRTRQLRQRKAGHNSVPAKNAEPNGSDNYGR